jgi:hypothetical protein
MSVSPSGQFPWAQPQIMLFKGKRGCSGPDPLPLLPQEVHRRRAEPILSAAPLMAPDTGNEEQWKNIQV